MKELSLITPINQLSYGLVGINVLSELSKRIKTNLFPIGQPQAEPRFHDCLRQTLANSQSYSANAPDIRIFHQFSQAEHVSKTLRIAYPIFELTAFNPVELNHLSQQDMIFVTSNWGKGIVEQNLKVPTKVIPLGVDRSIFNENYPKQQSEKTIFFHCGKIEIRKGHDVLPSMFDAIKNENNWELWISWFNHFMSPEDIKQWENTYINYFGDKVKFLPWIETQQEMAYVMSQTDVGIWPSRSEGWGLPILEYMSLGKPVITTNYSAMTEYCNPQNAHLINIDILETAYDGRWFHGFGTWAALEQNQVEQARQYIKELHNKRQHDGPLTNSAGLETAKQFAWSNTADKILQAINETL